VNLRHNARWIWPIMGIVLVALLAGGYILNKQRLENPFADRYKVHLEFDGVDAVTPGLGSPLTVAGVSVGQIDAVRLEDGKGVLRATVDRTKLPAVYEDATATLIPNTPLEDMQIRLAPGTREAGSIGDDGTVPIRSTTTSIESDELLRSFDADTRDWVQTLIANLGAGTKGRGRDLNSVLRTLGPTAAQTRRITSLLADRREKIAQLTHDLRVVAEAAADGDDDLRRVVDAGEATLDTLAVNRVPLERSLELLPPTLAKARSTLEKVQPLSRSLTTTLTELDPSLRTLRATLKDSPDALRGLVPLPVGELGDFVEQIAPLATSVRPAARDLRTSGPLLKTAFGVLEHASNAIAYSASPDSKSYLFWLAWFAHNANSTLSTQDAHGAVFRGYAQFSCGTGDIPALAELTATLFGQAGICPGGTP
jgi:phospholipid/cholesterol/gamma-HCH transport system substrate-binding protein